MDDTLAAWCAEHLGAAPVEEFFTAAHLSDVRGVLLDDGRRVAVKVRHDDPRIGAAEFAHAAAFAAGVDCARPLAGPRPLEGRPGVVVTAEAWLGGGTTTPAHLPGAAVAARFGRLLAQIALACPQAAEVPDLGPVPWLDYDHDAPDRAWPPPASDRWDPHRIEADLPPLLVELARRSRARLLADDARALPPFVGHADLSGINTRWFPPDDPARHGDVEAWRVVVHDWDSVVRAPHAVLAGVATGDHASTDRGLVAPIPDGAALLDAYAAELGRPWTPAEREIAWAAGIFVSAYTAAFEHLKDGRAGDGSAPVTDVLLADGEQRLALAGA